MFITMVALSISNPEQNELCTSYHHSALFSIFLIISFLFLFSQWGHCSKKTCIIYPSISNVPQRHPFFGHLSFVFRRREFLHFTNSNSDGLSQFFLMRTPRLSVLKASHCRTVLRNCVECDRALLVRHGSRTLGDESLILIGDSDTWKKHRNIVQRSFTAKATGESAAGIWALAQDLARSLVNSCESCERMFGEKLRMDILPLMKACALESFCKAALGRKLGCVVGHDDYSKFHLGSPSGDSAQEKRELHSIYQQMSSEAKAFEFMINDPTHRSRPSAFFNPFLQFYWIPTAYNRKYSKAKHIMNTFLRQVILHEKERMNFQKKTVQSNGNAQNHKASSNGNRFDARKISNQTSSQKLSDQEQAESNRVNLLTHLLRFTPDTSISNLTKILTTLLFAGFETTSTSLSCALYSLAKHPRCQERMAEEVIRVCSGFLKIRAADTKDETNANESLNNDVHCNGEENFVPREEDLAYTRAVVIESMRLHPSIPTTSRILKKNTKLDRDDDGSKEGGDYYIVAAGTRVLIPIDFVHRYEKNFERPLEFLPERWVRWEAKKEKSESADGATGSGRWVERDPRKEKEERQYCQDNKDYSNAQQQSTNSTYKKENFQADDISAAKFENFFAFSDGARNCVGRRLSLISQTLILASIVRALKVEIDEGYVIQKKNMLVVSPPEDAILILTKREKMKSKSIDNVIQPNEIEPSNGQNRI